MRRYKNSGCEKNDLKLNLTKDDKTFSNLHKSTGFIYKANVVKFELIFLFLVYLYSQLPFF